MCPLLAGPQRSDGLGPASSLLEMNNKPRSAVHLACAYGRPDILRLLLERGASNHFQLSCSGFSPYHSAVECLGDAEIAVLGDFGANASLLDKVRKSSVD